MQLNHVKGCIALEDNQADFSPDFSTDDNRWLAGGHPVLIICPKNNNRKYRRCLIFTLIGSNRKSMRERAGPGNNANRMLRTHTAASCLFF